MAPPLDLVIIYDSKSGMPRWKARGYLFQIYATDHPPVHVHVFKDGKLVARYDLEHRCFMEDNKRHHGRVEAALRELELI